MKFSNEIRMGEVLAGVSAMIAVFGAWSSVREDLGIIKNSQAAQAGSIQEIKVEQKAQGTRLEQVKEKVDRARL